MRTVSGPPLPTTPAAAYAQAFALHRDGRLDDALALLERALQRWPDHVDTRNLAGVLCMMRRDHAAAVRHMEHAVARGAGAGVLANLGFAYQALGDTARAADAYARATRLEPRLGFAWQKLGELQEAQGDPVAALASWQRAVECDPADLKSLGQALELRRNLADWDPGGWPSPADLLDGLRRHPRTDYSPGLLLALPEADAAMEKEAGARFARSQWPHALAAPPLDPQPRPLDGRRMRVGYLSTDFRNHAVSFLVQEVIAAHDRTRVEVFLYAVGPDPGDDPWRAAAVAAADHFADIEALEDRKAAQRIARDRLDVLVDLNGYTLHGRLGILAHRPAAVVASWIGYIGTLGEPHLCDYVIGDAIATPPELAPHFSESFALMPHCFQPNGRLRALPPPPSRASEGLPEGAVVFCSFNQTHKLHPALFDDWCAVLRAVPGSVLWLVPPRHPDGERNLRAEAARRGVDPDALVFARKHPREAHLARLALADVALDTWPYNSGTTGSDALRVGLPLVCLAGDTFAGRMAASLLHAVGMGDAVCADRTAYIATATALGADPAHRDAWRRRLQEGVGESPLFRPEACAGALEALMRAMHAARLAGQEGPVALADARI